MCKTRYGSAFRCATLCFCRQVSLVVTSLRGKTKKCLEAPKNTGCTYIMLNRYTFLLILFSTSTTVSACSFENDTQPLPIFTLSSLFVGLSILLFFRSFANRNIITLFIFAVLVIPIILVAISWESASPCSSFLQMLAPLELVASALILLVSFISTIWVKIKT